MKNHYEILSVPVDAPAEEIKRAFRREIARYHPDKVQHLGKEFQEMASGLSADLTEAYRILMDPVLRARFDVDLRGDGAPEPTPPPPAPSANPPRRPESSYATAPPAGSAQPTPPPAGPAPVARAAGIDVVRRATVAKLRQVIEDVLESPTALAAPPFDIAVATRSKKAMFKKADAAVCLVVRFVQFVDGDTVAQNWRAATEVSAPGASGCVLMLVGSGMASARELAAAVSDLRRRAHGTGPIVVPVDVRDWEALFPPDTPTSVRALLRRLKDEKP